jgi:hypothetical protein
LTSPEASNAFAQAVSSSRSKLAHAHVRHYWKSILRDYETWRQFLDNFVLKRGVREREGRKEVENTRRARKVREDEREKEIERKNDNPLCPNDHFE